MWVAVLKSGVRATPRVAWVFVPTTAQTGNFTRGQTRHELASPVARLPLFAANAGVTIEQGPQFQNLLSLNVTGLLIGKPVGVMIFCYFILRLALQAA